jgi:YegS/Rv2252/BmrU family lipid kinase
MAIEHGGTAPLPVLINRAGGSAAAAGDKLKDSVDAAFRQAGLAAEIHFLEASQIGQAITEHPDASLIVVGGGDGTLGAAASALLDHPQAALGILPLGTHNHFARQIGIPADLAGAARVLAEGRRRKVDVGVMNGRLFLNNASIGFYPSLVRTREQAQLRHGLPKWLANISASWAALRRLRHHRLRVELEGIEQQVRTPLLFVGNNVYALDGGRIGERRTLDEGRLSLYAVESRSRLGALWFGLKVLGGMANLQRDFAVAETCRSLTVYAHAPHIHVALDGEVCGFETPLRFEIRPLAIKVIVPADAKA